MLRRLALGVLLVTVVSSLSASELLAKGSDTMLNLVQRMAEAFAATQPDVTVSVAGGGSGVGINALTNGECAIANASRKIKSKEIMVARSNGVNPTEIIIALDALSVIVNAGNPVRRLTLQQLGAIYRGEITNWKQVGGPDCAIVLYGRQPASGTFVFFREEVVKADYASSMRQMNGNAQIVEAVKADRGGIGYVGLGYIANAEGFAPIALARDAGSEFVSPTDKTRVDAGLYPLTRPLYQYTNGKPRGGIRAFIEFEISPAGQRIAEEEGFLPVTAAYAERNSAVLR